MNQDLQYQQSREAHGRIKIVITRAADKYPFYANLLKQIAFRDDPIVQTIGVTVHGDDVRILFAPAFINAFGHDELLGVLLHVLQHLILNHVLSDPDDFPDEWARTISQEVTVNEVVKISLPARTITLKDFPELPIGESTDKRYHRLVKCEKRLAIEKFQLTEPHTHLGDRDQVRRRSDDDLEVTRSGDLVDNHNVWRLARADPARSANAIRTVLKDALALTAPNVLDAVMVDALLKLHGISTENAVEILPAGGGNTQTWEQLLRRYIGRFSHRHMDLRRPSRRCPDLVGIVSGRKRVHRHLKIMAVVDTSASMSSPELAHISKELERIAKRHEIVVVECDLHIQRVYRFRPIRDVRGRGGTSFVPPLERPFLRHHRPDVIVIFTDGHGSAPLTAPRPPVIWCLTADGQAPVSWGRVISMRSTP